MKILDFVERVTSLREMQEVWDYSKEVFENFGFNRVLYGFTRFRSGQSLGDPLDMLILTNHDRSYIRPFLDDGLYMNAPMTLWALENVGASSWRDTDRMAREGLLPPAACRIWEFNKSQGFLAGYTISFQSNSVRAKGALSLTSVPALSFEEVDEIWAEHGRTIEAMSNVLHLRLISMPNPETRRHLTPRQREALEWVGDGKTTAEIASIMGLTPATVEKHLRLAREALDVSTTAQAVLKAAFLHQIFGPRG
ncbi:helix-turn-helix transcriptional regulator [Tropicimonas sediminicola]|uniref:LuxR family transcriptional regulator n=1 Tax=Tropicimonas sediminicola TaxID=1031541 RepID=A0A239JU45_9RHOB|nr:LuxR family transcriptional regulator [Tropicimonas sediminicola]SNT09072.1 LuxR family transcriptional regulator [Tropicimonas sediminicola]